MNHAVVPRREQVRAVDAALDALPAGAFGVGAEQAADELSRFLSAFPVHLNALLDSSCPSEAPEGMAIAQRRLSDLVEVLIAESRLRPGASARVFLAVARELTRLWPVYREALTTFDMASAQSLASMGQAIIDRSTLPLDHAGRTQAAVNVLGMQEAEPSLVRRVLQAMEKLYPELGWSELAEEGARHARETIGRDVAAGAAFDFLVTETLASVYFVPDVFEQKLIEAVGACGNLVRVREIASMDSSVQEFGRLRRDIFETINYFAQAAERETRDAALVRRLVRSVSELYEDALPCYAWYKLLTGDAHGVDRYSVLAQGNSTDLTKKLEKHLQPVFVDMPAYLRNSGNHGGGFDYDETTGTVSFRLRSYTETVSLDVYLDRVLAFLESLLALSWALNEALERAGVDVPLETDDAQYMGLYQHDLAALWLEQRYGVPVRSDVEDGTWSVELDVPSTETLSIAIGLAKCSEPRVDRVTVLAPGLPREPIELNLDDYDNFAEQTERGGGMSLVAMLDLRHKSTCAGTCLLTEQDVEYIVVALSAALVNGQTKPVAPLRRARQLAQAHQMDDLASLATSTIAVLRTGDAEAVLGQIRSRHSALSQPGPPTGPVVTVHLSAHPHGRPCDA